LKSILKILLFLILLISKPAFSSLEYSKNIEQVHTAALKMDWNSFDKYIEIERKNDSSNTYIPYFIAYQSFIKSYFFGKNIDYQEFKKTSKSAIDLLEKENSDEAFVLASNLSIYRSFQFFLWDEKYLYAKSLLSCKDYLDKVQTKSSEAMKTQSLFEVIAYSVPLDYQSYASWFGVEGSAQKSIQFINQYLSSNKINIAQKTEAQIYKLYIYHFLGLETENIENDLESPILLYIDLKTSPKRASEKIKQIDNYKGAPLALFQLLKAQFLLQSQNAMGLKIMDDFLANKQIEVFKTFGLLQKARYYKAENELELLDQIKHEAINQAPVNFIPDQNALNKIKKLEGLAILLKSRQLFDAGEYQKSLNILLSINKETLNSVDQKIEFLYRLARVYDSLEQPQKALTLYQKVIDTGLSHLYFVSYSAYCQGNIYAQLGQKQDALKTFSLVKGLNQGEYKNSIEVKTRFAIETLQ
jgi:predicted negative regulator of RcsB-dependent stress response